MGDTEENVKKEEKHEDKDGKGEKVKDKKKKKDKKKEKNPEDKKDATKLKSKLENIDAKIRALNVKREEILKLIEEAESSAPAEA